MAKQTGTDAAEITFARERETKGAVRWQEIVPDGATALIGTLYTRKDGMQAAGIDENATAIAISVRAL